MIRSLIAEFLSTVIFGFFVYGSIISSSLTGGLNAQVGNIGVPVGFGAVAIIYAFSKWAPAHFNPAITLGAILAGKMCPIKGSMYMLSQFLGALVAMGLIYASNPTDVDLAEILTARRNANASITNAIVMEVILTFILVWIAIMAAIAVMPAATTVTMSQDVESGENTESKDNVVVTTDMGNNGTAFGPLAIGLTLGGLVFLGGASSGGVFNPSLAFAPSCYSGSFKQIYIYLGGEFIGGALAGLLYRLIFIDCKKKETSE